MLSTPLLWRLPLKTVVAPSLSLSQVWKTLGPIVKCSRLPTSIYPPYITLPFPGYAKVRPLRLLDWLGGVRLEERHGPGITKSSTSL